MLTSNSPGSIFFDGGCGGKGLTLGSICALTTNSPCSLKGSLSVGGIFLVSNNWDCSFLGGNGSGLTFATSTTSSGGLIILLPPFGKRGCLCTCPGDPGGS